MKTRVLSLLAIFVIASAFVTVDASSDRHFGLSKSVPAAGASVGAPDEITLWFTQVPQENSISIRLVDAKGDLVPSTDPKQDAQDGKVFSITPSSTLGTGSYTVAWRGIGQDGHTVRGDFGFSVATR